MTRTPAYLPAPGTVGTARAMASFRAAIASPATWSNHGAHACTGLKPGPRRHLQTP